MSTPNRKKKQRARAVPREAPHAKDNISLSHRSLISHMCEDERLQFEETASVEETEPIVPVPVAPEPVAPTPAADDKLEELDEEESETLQELATLSGNPEKPEPELSRIEDSSRSYTPELSTSHVGEIEDSSRNPNPDSSRNPNPDSSRNPNPDSSRNPNPDPELSTSHTREIEDPSRNLMPEHQELPVEEVTPVCVECDNPKCAGGHLYSIDLRANRERYLREPPELGFDIVIKARASDGRVEKFHFSKYCLTALRYFRTMLTSGLREQKEQEIDLTEFGSDLVLRLLSRLDPLSEIEQPFRTGYAAYARRLIDFLNLVGGPLSEYRVISEVEMQHCVYSLSLDPDPTDLARMIDYGLSQHIPTIVNGLMKTHHLKNQTRDWYLGLIIRKELQPKFRSRLAIEFAASGHLTSPGEAALVVEAQTTIRKKLKLLYVAAGDVNLSRAILADLGRQANVGAIPAHVLYNAVASLPDMIRTLKDRGTLTSVPMPIAPQVEEDSNR